MEKFEKYNKINEAKKGEFYKFVLNDIHISVGVIIEELKEKYNMSCWYVYESHNSLTLNYFQKSDDSPKNIMEIKKFLFDKLPYFRDLSCYDDDNRLVLRFVEVGDPVRIKFNK